jgi:3'-phosphoadenosine 5'-phosphosulfate sulfotransferase (PAPS reductase)/FAD synthetase
MKKKPSKQYEKKTKNKPFIGTMASDSKMREAQYLLNGCNAFDVGRPRSTPLGFWTEQDILQYLKENNLPYASVYGNIRKRGGQLETTGVKRTGCMFCMFGVHLEPEPNRFQRMQITHPDRWAYCTGGGQMVNGKWVPSNKGLGIGFILDYIGVPWKNDEGLWPMKELIRM